MLKKILFLFLASGMLFSCQDNLDVSEESRPENNGASDSFSYLPDTLVFALPSADKDDCADKDCNADKEADSRLIFDEVLFDDKPTLFTRWKVGDGFRVNGTFIDENNYIIEDESQTCIYNLISGENTSSGVFATNDSPLGNEFFYLYYPSDLKNWNDFCLMSLDNQTQTGNGNTDHLSDYFAFDLFFHKDNIISFEKVSNSDQTGCLKFNLKGFDYPITPEAIELSVVDGNNKTVGGVLEKYVNAYTGSEESLKLNLRGFEPTTKIAAYMMMPVFDIDIPANCSLRVKVYNKEGKPVIADKPAGGKTMRGGYYNVINVTGGWQTAYESSDDSMDKEWFTLQKATAGNGIDIYLMGDGFSDRQIADNTYREVMINTMEAFFSEEPYKSFRDCFNVYYINAVSKNEGEFDGENTAFECEFGMGTYIEGNLEKCTNYANIIFYGINGRNMDYQDMNKATVIIPLNSSRHSGTCHFGAYNFHYPAPVYGDGYSFAFFTVGTDIEHIYQLTLHEAGGHGFGKLLDEYSYEGNSISYSNINQNITYRNDYGWGWNVDYTSDPQSVVWAKFLTDGRFDGQGLGVFEGGDTYDKGVYRSTENSIMRYNTGGYNAPSREAIYYRIQKLAFGKEPDYEEFVEWDLNHRSRSSRSFTKVYPPTAEPVIVKDLSLPTMR